jgi:hypothetical protein
MEKPTWRQVLHSEMKNFDSRKWGTIFGVSTVYIGALLMMIILPTKLIPEHTNAQTPSVDPNVAPNNNYLPADCPSYMAIANSVGQPLSTGPLKLPFQRPLERCRTFTSAAMEKLIANMTSRMVDKDLARLFENTFPNTLGTSVLNLF